MTRSEGKKERTATASRHCFSIVKGEMDEPEHQADGRNRPGEQQGRDRNPIPRTDNDEPKSGICLRFAGK